MVLQAECLPITSGCFSLWCPCILYGKTQEREAGNPDPSMCNGSVKPSPLDPYPLDSISSNSFSSSALVVALSHAAVFNHFCNVPLAAVCATGMVLMAMHAVTALAHGAVLAVYWCRKIRR